MGEWTPDEREALRTLAAASPDVRAEAIHDVLGDGDHDDPPVARTEGGPGHTGVHERSGGGTIDAGPEPPPRAADQHDVAHAWGTTVEPSDPGPQPGPAAGGEGGGPPSGPSAADPDTLFPGGQGGGA
jgi:hypothetical protein